ncbi:MAG: D-alanyl-D-alanine carboxypeptidase [Lachnospiraceae bacterium]|nr:D-alanyl-D-alanine carboxypeptidase [Lachnospiraceae bacterium]
MAKRISSVLLIGALITLQLLGAPPVAAYAEEIGDYDLYATAAVLMDGESGRILYGKNADQVMPMASTTKIMTCIIALENGNLEDTVTASAYAASQPKVHLGMVKGYTYRLEDLLYSLMLESHNDSAVAIAEHIGGAFLQLPPTQERSQEESRQAVAAFAVLMNRKAADLGLSDTWFITPNGLDASQEVTLENGETVTRQHATTAAELACIMRYCAWQSPQKDKFLEITRQRSYFFAELSGRGSYTCNNHNSFLDMMEGALTGKTGFTNAAGYCYVGALEADGKRFTVALLACGWPDNKTWKWADTKKLMNYGLNNYAVHSFSEYAYDAGNLSPVSVAGGQSDGIGAAARVGVEIIGREQEDKILLREDEEIQVSCRIEEVLQAPVEKGENVGIITYQLNGEILWTEFVVTTGTVDKIDFRWCMRQILAGYLLG